ncbi:MAG: CHAP domain-containing protein [Myxococcales bacterium]|nr:CHAP domain-containing protein [Myxococcales bacterium]
MKTVQNSILHTLLTAALLTGAGSGLSACAMDDSDLARAEPGLELIPISEHDVEVLEVFEGLRATAEANGVLALAWDDVADPSVAWVEIWRPSMDKWSDLAGGEWNPALDHWGEMAARIPVGAAQWLDPAALVLDDNRYILRTIGFDGQVRQGFVVEARPARVTFRAANWSDEPTNGVGTHDVDGTYVNVRGDGLDTVLFTANRGELLTLSYQTAKSGDLTYYEVFFKSGVHEGERGWVAADFLRFSTLEVCSDKVSVRSEDLGSVVGTVNRGTVAYVTDGTVRNTGQYRYFKVNAGGVQGYVATEFLCPKGTSGGTGNGGGGNGGGGANSGNYDAAAAKLLANEAYAGSVGYSMGRCYQYAWAAMTRAIGITESRANQLGIPATSAYQFGDWADAHPTALYQDFGLKAIDSTSADAPVGSVVVWDPGQCGFNYTHGHIEIVTSPGYACSDFCGYMYNDCGKPRVYMPVQ